MGFLTFLATLCSIISIPLAIYFYFKSTDTKKIIYCTRSIKLIDNIPNDSRLKLTFKDKEIKRVVLTKIAIWNGGSKSINHTDFSIKKPLKVCFKDPELVMETYLLYKDNYIEQLHLKKIQDGSVGIEFNYIDPGEGILLQILHEGDTENWSSVKGILKNSNKNKVKEVSYKFFGKNITKADFFINIKSLISLSASLTVFALGISLISITNYILNSINLVDINLFSDDSDYTGGIFDGIFLLVSSVFMMILIPSSYKIGNKITSRIERWILHHIKRLREPSVIDLLLSEDWSITENNLVQWD